MGVYGFLFIPNLFVLYLKEISQRYKMKIRMDVSYTHDKMRWEAADLYFMYTVFKGDRTRGINGNTCLGHAGCIFLPQQEEVGGCISLFYSFSIDQGKTCGSCDCQSVLLFFYTSFGRFDYF